MVHTPRNRTKQLQPVRLVSATPHVVKQQQASGDTTKEPHYHLAIITRTSALTVSGDPAPSAKSSAKRRSMVNTPTQVHGWWVPAQIVAETAHYQVTYDVDLVPDPPTRAQRRRSNGVAATGEPGWVQLWVAADAKPRNRRVVAAASFPGTWQLHVTKLTVQPLQLTSPLPPRGTKRWHAVVDHQVRLSPGVLLRLATDALQLHGVLRPPRQRGDAAVLDGGVTSKAATKHTRTRTQPTPELLASIRRAHHAAPHGTKYNEVLRQHPWLRTLSNAEKWVRRAKLAEPATKSHTKHTKGSKT